MFATFSDEVTATSQVNFNWVDDVTLRDVLACNLVYTQKLMIKTNTVNDLKLRRLLDRDIAIHIGSIVEALLLYGLFKYDELDLVDYNSKHKRYKICKLVKSVNLVGDEYLAIVEPNKIKLTKNIQFIDINRLALKCGLLTDRLFESAETIREERNKIHSKNSYSIKDVKEIYKQAREIKRRIFNKLNDIPKKQLL
jgi:hypothetical protein